MQYKLQIYPSYGVNAQTKKLKRMLFNRVGEYRYLHSHPHITLLYFVADSQWELELVNVIKETIEGFSKFRIYLKDVACFEKSGTLYIGVEPQGYLQMLARHVHHTIRDYSNRQKGELSRLTAANTMHMTVGSSLSAENLAAGHKLLKKQEYETSFEATGVKFLSNAGSGTGNNLVSEFNFGGGPHPGGPAFRDRIASTVAASLSEAYATAGAHQLTLF